jgi:hypothetical protein
MYLKLAYAHFDSTYYRIVGHGNPEDITLPPLQVCGLNIHENSPDALHLVLNNCLKYVKHF